MFVPKKYQMKATDFHTNKHLDKIISHTVEHHCHYHFFNGEMTKKFQLTAGDLASGTTI